jgi:hypothetical protein
VGHEGRIDLMWVFVKYSLLQKYQSPALLCDGYVDFYLVFAFALQKHRFNP